MHVCVGFQVLFSAIYMLWVGGALGKAVRANGLKELMPWSFRIRCDLNCLYGYQTDVEGNYVCLCYNPCENVLCFANTKCVVDLPKACLVEDCRPLATCRDVGPGSPLAPPTHGLLLGDDATTTSSDTSVPDRCFLQVEDRAKQCRKARARWFYDDVTRTCQPFWGCRTQGNNFRGRRGCEKTCLVTRPSKSNKKPRVKVPQHYRDDLRAALKETSTVSSTSAHAQTEVASVCTLPAVPVTAGCTKLRRHWYFDVDSGKCRKFRGCSTPGNNFTKKKHCKSTCISSPSGRREKRYLTWLAKQ